MIDMKTKPRGLRNHNPLNIRIGNNWQGENHPNTDGAFEQFIDDCWGYRAAVLLIGRYIVKYQRNTIRKIIKAWAPPSENNTSAYIRKVCRLSGIPEDAVIDTQNQSQMCDLIHAMAVVENGCECPMEPIVKGYEMATLNI